MVFSFLKKSFYFLFPFTSFLVFPFIQGTTPAFLLCFLFLVFLPLFVRAPRWVGFYKIIIGLIFVLACLIVFSQAGVLFTRPSPLVDVPLVNSDNAGALFLRGSIFTQSLYFLAAITAFSFVTNFYEEKDVDFIFGGIRLLIFYGLVEFIVFLLTGEQTDFISNRTFDGEGSGSLFQTITIGGLNIQRMKSLTGEPSMFAFTILPFWILAIEFKRKTDTILTTSALILSLSTTAVLGFLVYGIYKLFRSNIRTKLILLTSIACVLSLTITLFRETMNDIWDQIIIGKISADNVSGQDRSGNILLGLEYWRNANLWIQLFGVGFGIVRSTDFFTTLLLNNGVVGLVLWLLLFFTPFLVIARKIRVKEMNKLFPCVLVIIITLFLSVPEYMYLSIWVPLGIAYNLLGKKHDTVALSSSGEK